MMRRIDLLPSTYAEQRREKRNFGLVLLAGLSVLALLLFYWVILGARVGDKKDQLASIETQNRALQADIAQLQNFQALADEVAAKQQALATVTALDVDWSSLLTEIALVTPSDVWLTQLQGSRVGSEGETLAPTETAEVRIARRVPAGRLTFSGRALTMPAVAQWLLRLGEVRGVTAVYLQNAIEEEVEEQSTISFDSSVELTERLRSDRFSPEDSP